MISEDLLKRANDGDVEAMLDIGDAYFYGKGVEEDNAAAGVWFLKAFDADPENPRVLKCMGNAYKWGCGVEKNEMTAMQYFRRSAMKGYAPAQYNYAKGLRQRGDEECLDWYEKAYKNGDKDAAYAIGQMNIEGELVEKDITKGLKYLQKGVDMGSNDAMLALGYYYLETEEEKAHVQQGLQLMRQAADEGNSAAAENLAIYYRLGENVPADMEKSLEWARKAAELGEYEQLVSCGEWYIEKNDDPGDKETALSLFNEAYDAGYKEAAFAIAEVYFNESNFDLAIEWYDKAIAAKLYDACFYRVDVLLRKCGFEDFDREGVRATLLYGAENGSVKSQFALGAYYYEGGVLEKDIPEAVKWLSKASEGGHAYAAYYLGLIYNDEKLEYYNPLSAFACFEAACEDESNDNAAVQLADIYREGKVVPKDIEKARSYYQRAADLGNAFGYSGLALCCMDTDKKAAREYMIKAKELGYPGADVMIAHLSGPEDIFADDLKLAKNGDAESQFRVFRAYFSGEGAEKNTEKAFKWCRLAAKQNYAPAQTQMGIHEFFEGNVSTAVRYLELACDGGDTFAMMFLADIYDNGNDAVAKDTHKAFMLYLRAAEAGNVDGMRCAGMCYTAGSGVAKNDAKAFEWYMKAAERGDAQCMAKVGYCYCSGIGVAADDAKAVQWLQKAVNNGQSDAKEILDGLLTNSSEEIVSRPSAEPEVKPGAKSGETVSKGKSESSGSINTPFGTMTTFNGEDQETVFDDFGDLFNDLFGSNSDAGGVQSPVSKPGKKHSESKSLWTKAKEKRNAKRSEEERKYTEALNWVANSDLCHRFAVAVCEYFQQGAKYYDFLSRTTDKDEYTVNIDVGPDSILITAYSKTVRPEDSTLFKDRYNYPQGLRGLNAYQMKAFAADLGTDISLDSENKLKASVYGNYILVKWLGKK